jgi:plasmid stabilization system protein ParE
MEWLAERSPVAAKKAAQTVLISLDQLNDFALLAPEEPDGTRLNYVSFGRDGFLVRYRVLAEGILVEDVMHGRSNR